MPALLRLSEETWAWILSSDPSLLLRNANVLRRLGLRSKTVADENTVECGTQTEQVRHSPPVSPTIDARLTSADRTEGSL